MIELLPTVNATLNGVAALLLTAGLALILTGHKRAHQMCMSAALAVSAAFLACYLVYHAQVGSTPFPGTGGWRFFYLYVLLLPHIVLAVVMLPMIAGTFWLAWTGRFGRHRRLARWTLPVWLYVSVTGVVVYVMLYHIDWTA